MQGYVLVEFSTLDEARRAVEGGHGLELLEQKVVVEYAFVRPPPANKGSRGRDAAARGEDRRGSARGKGRSRSPGRDAEDMDE